MKRALALALLFLALFALDHRSVLVMGKSLDSYQGRLVAWRVGLEVWWEHFRVFGAGAGGWGWYIPQWADRFKELGAQEAFLNAHSLPVTLLFEQGAVGLALAIYVVWGHRHGLVRNPVAWALAILCLGSFPLFVAQVAAVALVALAMTWTTPPRPYARTPSARLCASPQDPQCSSRGRRHDSRGTTA